jgi:small-conductance mechanosensitive channel
VIGVRWLFSSPLFGAHLNTHISPKANRGTTRSSGTYLAFVLVLLGALVSTVVFGLSLWFQVTIRFPTLIGTSLEYQITQYLLMDAITLLGAILLYFSSLLIYFRSSWPFDALLAFIGAFITLAIISVVLGVIGGIIALFNRPHH